MKFYNKTTLQNGIRVLTQETNSIKSFTLGIWVNVGSRDEESKLNGLSHFIEHCVFKGTKNRTAKEIASSIEGLGAYLNAYTSKEHTCFYVRGLSDNFVQSFEFLLILLKIPFSLMKKLKKKNL